MRITRIRVMKLYGIHNYDILFDKEECVKIIHAPNGYGKTTILKLIKAIILGERQEIRKVPFENFWIYFDIELSVQVKRREEKIIYELQTAEKVVVSELIEQPLDTEQMILQNSLKNIAEKMPIYFIDANRLWLQPYPCKKVISGQRPTVLNYAKELKNWMKEALLKANFYSQQLDRSFPLRVFQQRKEENKKTLSKEQLKKDWNDLETRRTLLESVGLFTPSVQKTVDYLEEGNEEVLDIFALYLEDSKEKIKILEELALKIHLLCQLINQRFSYKVMETNIKDGFVFKVPTHERLQADQLSSGEQNELILIFILLFKAPRDALILMDEPEISLHIAWQQSFLEDMETIAQLSNIRMMIATHSPDIINGRWELTTGLEEEE